MVNLIQPISFYDKLSEQDSFKESSVNFKFLSDERLIPFQIKVPDEITSIKSFSLIGYKYRFEIDLDSSNSDYIKIILGDSGKKYVVFFGGENLKFKRLTNYPEQPPIYTEEDLSLCSDHYYYEVTLNNDKKYFSERFYLNGSGICDSEINLEINSWNDSDKQGYTFKEGFKFKSYFNSFIHSRQAQITNEYVKNGFDIQILKRRVISFPYSFEVDPLPFSISNGLAVLTAFDNFVIKENGNEYTAENIDVEIEPIEGTTLDRITFSFTIKGSDIIKTFC